MAVASIIESIIEQLGHGESDLCWMTKMRELIRIPLLSDDHLENIIRMLEDHPDFIWPAFLSDYTYLGEKNCTYWMGVMSDEVSSRCNRS